MRLRRRGEGGGGEKKERKKSLKVADRGKNGNSYKLNHVASRKRTPSQRTGHHVC